MRQDLEDFVARLLKRRPHLDDAVQTHLTARVAVETNGTGVRIRALETIVSEQRPVFFASTRADEGPAINFQDAAVIGQEAQFLKEELTRHETKIARALGRVGRIDVEGMTGTAFVGTGWMIDDGIVVTNRHVAEVVARRSASGFSFRMGAAGRPVSLQFATGHLNGADDPGLAVPVASVLYIEPAPAGPDIAFLRLSVEAGAGTVSPLTLHVGSVDEATPLCVLGYPAKASARVIPDQMLMDQLYRGVYDVKRVAPGFVARQASDLIAHDCTTLGGNSGSALTVIATGAVAGLHFAGIYLRENHAVPAAVLRDYRDRRRWLRPPSIETAPPPAVSPVGGVAAHATTTITITITVAGGNVTVNAGSSGAASVERVERAAAALLGRSAGGVLAARVGYDDDGTGPPVIVASVLQSRLGDAGGLPSQFDGIRVRYEAATLSEQVDARAVEEASSAIAYDDDARRSPDFSLDPIVEQAAVRCHLSPEYGFEELKAFFSSATGPLDSAMYEMQGQQLADMIEMTLGRGVEMALAADRKSAPPDKPPAPNADPLTYEVARQFTDWQHKYKFTYQIVPLGSRGLVASAYHIKVTVNGDRFWLSSGNWKNRSSQPLVDEAMRRHAVETDLPGNREWHLAVRNETLANRFRNHIRQDVKRSSQLAGQEGLLAEPLVTWPATPEAVEERKPPSRILRPLDVDRSMRVQPILTPDRGGRAYLEPVLDLIRSARRSLVFQIPYIGMRPDPLVHRGAIDDLIDALVEKLLTLDDARVLLRAGNDRYSDNRHVSWYFRSRGIDTARVRQIVDHHTKGMVVDGSRVLVGSHNWSSQGVSVNRDASVIVDEPAVAGYFGEAFEIDWDRSTPVSSKRYVREMPELLAAGREAPADRGVVGVRPLREVLSEMDV